MIDKIKLIEYLNELAEEICSHPLHREHPAVIISKILTKISMGNFDLKEKSHD